MKIAYYRGVYLPVIGNFEIAVDGEKFDVDQMRFKVGHKTYTWDETAKAEDVHWDYGEPLTITVLKPGGISPGTHEVYFSQTIKPSYGFGGGNVSSTTKIMTLVK